MLALGGYEREYFISQTPELAAMADAVIDLDAYVVMGRGAGDRLSSMTDADVTA